MSPRVRIIVYAVVAISLLAFLCAVWPTLYRYDHADTTAGGLVGNPKVVRKLIRVNRITGQACVLSLSDGWTPIVRNEPGESSTSSGKSSTSKKRQLETVLDIDGRGGLRNSGFLWEGNFYNGTEWTLKELTVEFRYPDLTREYRLTCNIPAKSSGDTSALAQIIREANYPSRPANTVPWSWARRE